MPTIAIIEDNLLHADYISTVVSRIENCKVITIQNNGFAFIQYCSINKLPDIAIIDIEMPVMDGVSLTDYLCKYYPSIAIIALSSYSHREAVEDMLACGAKGYVCKLFPKLRGFNVIKHNPHFNLNIAVQTVANGGYYIDEHITLSSENEGYAFNIDQLVAKRLSEKEKLAAFGLTKAEQKIAALYAATNVKQDDISQVLDVKTKTLNKQVQSVYSKLGVGTRQGFSLRSISINLIKIARGIGWH